MRELLVKEGILEIDGANAVWMDPVAVLSSSYSGYEVSHSQYYSRSLYARRNFPTTVSDNHGSEKGSRKRKRKKTYALNEKEVLAQLRHEDSRLAILNAHHCFLATTFPKISLKISIESLESPHGTISADKSTDVPSFTRKESEECDLDFLQLAEVWQAPMYELTILKGPSKIMATELIASTHQLFNTVIEHKEEETVAECTEASFLLPRNCRFLISDVTQVHQLVPGKDQDLSNFGFNLILIDPPWENKSVRRNSVYPMIPNRKLLSLPVKQLAHEDGALIALWLTNRQKLHQFVERELFPAWGVRMLATWYWLKVNSSGDMISSLDLQHHKPYECLLLGYLQSECKEASSVVYNHEAVQNEIFSIDQTAPPDKFVVDGWTVWTIEALAVHRKALNHMVSFTNLGFSVSPMLDQAC